MQTDSLMFLSASFKTWALEIWVLSRIFIKFETHAWIWSEWVQDPSVLLVVGQLEEPTHLSTHRSPGFESRYCVLTAGPKCRHYALSWLLYISSLLTEINLVIFKHFYLFIIIYIGVDVKYNCTQCVIFWLFVDVGSYGRTGEDSWWD